MQAFRKETVEDKIRRIRQQAAKKAYTILVKYNKACRQSQELEQRIQDAHKETVELLVPLLEQGTDLSKDPEADRITKQLEKRIDKIGDKIAKTQGRIEVYDSRREAIQTNKEAKVEELKRSVDNSTILKPSVRESEDSVATNSKPEEIVTSWLNTQLNRRTSFRRPPQRSRSLKRSASEGLRVRWSEELLIDDTLDAVAEGLAPEVTVVKEGSRRQFDPQDTSTIPDFGQKLEKQVKRNKSQRSLHSIITIPEEIFPGVQAIDTKPKEPSRPETELRVEEERPTSPEVNPAEASMQSESEEGLEVSSA
ncbi:hypothetical protein TWF696_007573 [Orbilia brochopaga]|uniref:Uncharacterized protein n=1 Tax=Orbilia brochopaga TaxID=3140254 RepID=A0AAV9UP91_9PEZI